MTTIKWLGEDTEGQPGASFIVWNNVKLPKDVAVEVTDEHMIRKAKLNPHRYVVTESTKAPDTPAPKPKEAPRAQTPEKKVEAKPQAKPEEKKEGPKTFKKDPRDYPPVLKKRVRKPKAKATAHVHR